MSLQQNCLLVVVTATCVALPGGWARGEQAMPVAATGAPPPSAISSPWCIRLGAGAAYLAGSTTTDYRHPNPAISPTGHFAGAAAEMMATGAYQLNDRFQVGVALGVTYAPELSTGAHVEWAEIRTLVLGQVAATGAWSPQGSPFVLELGLGLGGVIPGGAQAAIRDPDARFVVEDARGLGPQGHLGVTFFHPLSRRTRLGATLRGTGMMLFGNDVSTTAWIGSAAVVLQL